MISSGTRFSHDNPGVALRLLCLPARGVRIYASFRRELKEE